ncbi:MAG: T9SS type A sorting domain-containing protein [Candidatus Cloacimonetes bacterium]|nr:T9SS type A sorting domain-containing protein [Candidatus Cloacimonadota bacterium]MCF7814167.1 T9SS type A sorting domain-containing protein [Candidatus Cloacimonadota bacterium]MCF7868770.1 T9SS type A sorting domain-containing protein [Candidatus Cloacimonadota bacterium]MCF7884173.1 T9SS type A sorting domain-containing protein [Candidatus Cloacimonadota bacterium]
MKKLLIVSLFVVLFACIWAEHMQPIYKNAEEVLRTKKPRVYENTPRDIPDWNFAIEPVGIMTNYYDYMPGSYNSIPIRVQTTADGGIYLAFHARETAASTRRVYYAYIDANGNLTNSATIGTQDIHEGYPGIDLDPVTGDPIVAWHVNIDASTVDEEVVVSYDLYHLGSPGLWKTPFIVIDDNIPSAIAPDDVFVWPYVYVGPSPTAGKRRVYVIASNNDESPNGNPSENNMFAYADFDENDFNAQSELDWTYRTIPMLDDWHAGNPEWVRPTHAVALDEDGTVALFGYTVTEDASTSMADKLYAFVNTNYGEGDFVYQETSCHYDVDNPLNQDGTPYFVDPDTGQPHDIYFAPYLCNHQNVIMQDGCLYFLGNVNMLLYPDSWYPDLPMMYPKMYKYDIVNEEFSFQDMYITGANPNDDNVMLPWDLDEDGQVDEYDPDGYVTWVDGWPIYHYDNGVAFDENHWQVTQNEDNGWMVAVWSEGLKSRLGNIPEPGYEDWAEFPEVAVAVSRDGGDTWSETILMNAKTDDDNYAPELDGMIPVYVYTGDVIEDMGNEWGRLHLMFLDDNSYGSTIAGHGENLGGTMMYAAIDIDFSSNGSNPVLPTPTAILDQNYPNPFNPTTTIKYQIKSTGHVSIDVFNVKGQKVATLVNRDQSAGNHQVIWDGKEADGSRAASGIYFYKLQTDEYSVSKKMILMK